MDIVDDNDLLSPTNQCHQKSRGGDGGRRVYSYRIIVKTAKSQSDHVTPLLKTLWALPTPLAIPLILSPLCSGHSHLHSVPWTSSFLYSSGPCTCSSLSLREKQPSPRCRVRSGPPCTRPSYTLTVLCTSQETCVSIWFIPVLPPRTRNSLRADSTSFSSLSCSRHQTKIYVMHVWTNKILITGLNATRWESGDTGHQ